MTIAPLTPPPIDPHTMALIRMAVREDLGHATYGTTLGDRTVELSIPQETHATATIVARSPGTISGTYLLPTILREYQPGIDCTILTPDGLAVQKNQAIAQIQGPARAILSAERVLLNFLGHLSGIATLTRRYVDAVAGARPGGDALICDTRKTTPAYRVLDKYAVRCGGGTNHRLGLYDGVMLKDNHLAALRQQLGSGVGGGGHLSLYQLTQQIRAQLPAPIPLWLEVDTLEQLQDALPPLENWKLKSGNSPAANIILLDNFAPDQLRQAVQLRNTLLTTDHCPLTTPLLESSGGITLDNVRAIAETGVERISIGALTHSAPILDLSMEFA